MEAIKVCTCDTVYKVLPKLGLKKPSTEPSTHMVEEEAYLLPHLPRDVADRIRMEHEEFRAQIKVYGRIVNVEAFEAHAKYEDEMVRKYLPNLLGAQGARAAGLQTRMLENRLASGIPATRARIGATEDGMDSRFVVLGLIGAGLIVASFTR